MSTEIYKSVLYNDGEGLTHGDANDSQDYMKAVIWDKITQSLIGNTKLTGAFYPEFGGNNGVDAPTHLAYCLHGGSAYLRPGSTANKVQIAPGVLMQKVGSSAGNAATLIAYCFAGTEEVSISTGDATNPRVDLVQMKLEYITGDLQSRDFEDGTTHAVTTQSMYKKKYVQCTLSVKAGTAAANPTIPDPDAGYVAVASVVVRPTYATTTQILFGYESLDAASAWVMDQRMPVNIQTFTTEVHQLIGKTAWAVVSDFTMQSSSATNELWAPAHKGQPSRLLGITFRRGHTAADWVDSTSNYFFARSGGGTQVLHKITSGFSGDPGAAGIFTVPYYTFEGVYTTHTSTFTPTFTINPSATNKIGVPIWGAGACGAWLTPYATSSDSGALLDALYFRFVSGASGTEVTSVKWHWACGM